MDTSPSDLTIQARHKFCVVLVWPNGHGTRRIVDASQVCRAKADGEAAGAVPVITYYGEHDKTNEEVAAMFFHPDHEATNAAQEIEQPASAAAEHPDGTAGGEAAPAGGSDSEIGAAPGEATG